MDFGVLGPLTVRRAGVPLELGTPKGRLLLAVLLSRPGRPVSDDALVEAVWGGEQPKSAAKNVQTYVHRLRHRLGDPGRIAREGRGYVLRADRTEVDAARFEDLAGAARTALAAGERDRSRRLFEEALGLWRGPALGDFSGQRAELAEIEARLRTDRAVGEPAATVTISGPGGVGKTALAGRYGPAEESNTEAMDLFSSGSGTGGATWRR